MNVGETTGPVVPDGRPSGSVVAGPLGDVIDATLAPSRTSAAPRTTNHRERPRIERRDGYLLWVGGPVPPGSAGITIGSLVILRRRARDRTRLLRHELVHVEQYARYGIAGFLGRYVVSYLRLRLRGHPHAAAYRRIPLEIEAYWRERR